MSDEVINLGNDENDILLTEEMMSDVHFVPPPADYTLTTNAPLKVYRVSEHAKLPTQGTAHAACYDIYADLKGDSAKEILIYTYHHEGMTYTRPTAARKAATEDGKFYVGGGERALIPTGLIFDIPLGLCIQMYPRSGASFKRGIGLANSVGVIDCDYVEQSYIPVINLNPNNGVWIEHGERLAQIEITNPIMVAGFEEIPEKPEQKTDRKGGFGSTGQ